MFVSPVFPLGTTYLPGDRVSLNIFEERYIHMCSVLENTNHTFVSVLIERGSEVGGSDRRHNHGVIIQVTHVNKENDVISLTGLATKPVDIIQWLQDDPFPRAECDFPVHELGGMTDHKSTVDQLINIAHRLKNPMTEILIVQFLQETDQTVPNCDDLIRFMWSIAGLVPSGPQDRHSLLQHNDLSTQIRLLSDMVTHYEEVKDFQSRQ